MIEELKKFLNSEEGQQEAEKFFSDLKNQEKIEKLQLERFHEKYSNRFTEILDKIIIKYESNEYKDREYKIGYEPRKTLYFFMFEYAKKYGREVTDEEYNQYENYFTGEMFYIEGYYIQIMLGQGSIIKINKK